MTRTGNRLTMRFDAVALDWTPVTGLAPEFVAGVRAEGTSVLVDLGPNAAGYRADDSDADALEIDLLAPAPGAAAATPTASAGRGSRAGSGCPRPVDPAGRRLLTPACPSGRPSTRHRAHAHDRPRSRATAATMLGAKGANGNDRKGLRAAVRAAS